MPDLHGQEQGAQYPYSSVGDQPHPCRNVKRQHCQRNQGDGKERGIGVGQRRLHLDVAERAATRQHRRGIDVHMGVHTERRGGSVIGRKVILANRTVESAPQKPQPVTDFQGQNRRTEHDHGDPPALGQRIRAGRVSRGRTRGRQPFTSRHHRLPLSAARQLELRRPVGDQCAGASAQLFPRLRSSPQVMGCGPEQLPASAGGAVTAG